MEEAVFRSMREVRVGRSKGEGLGCLLQGMVGHDFLALTRTKSATRGEKLIVGSVNDHLAIESSESHVKRSLRVAGFENRNFYRADKMWIVWREVSTGSPWSSICGGNCWQTWIQALWPAVGSLLVGLQHQMANTTTRVGTLKISISGDDRLRGHRPGARVSPFNFLLGGSLAGRVFSFG